jgi:3-hydroxyisobutyrate dehydrogenase
MGRIAFLSLGAMGLRMVSHLIASGNDVTVWNRTPKAMAGAIVFGARASENPQLPV